MKIAAAIPILAAMRFVPFPELRGCAGVLAIAAALTFFTGSPARAFDLFARHQVTAQFATPQGKPMANAEVRVFAPGEPNKPALTGHTDKDGKFIFTADRDGFWTAEARSKDEVARIIVRVPGAPPQHRRISPLVVIGGLALLVVLAGWYRVARARVRRPPS